jgi:ribonuclease HI
VQKLLFGLLMASRKLRHYFQAHEITVVARFPLQRILRNPDATGRIVEWALELSSFVLKFESTSTIHSRASAEFIAEWTPTPDEEIQETTLPDKETAKEWIMHFDGAFSLQGTSAGVLLVAPTGEHLKYVVHMHFPREKATNNTAEYEGLLAGLRIAVDLGIRKLIIRGDSQLVVKQVNKDYQSPLMETYMEEVRKLEEHFDGLQTEHIPRAKNSIAGHLLKCAAQKLPVEPGTFVLHLTQPSITPSMHASKRRKLNTGKYFSAELPEAAGKEVAGNNNASAGERRPRAEPQVLVVEASTPAAEEMPLILVVEP